MKASRSFPGDPGSITLARRFVLQTVGDAPRELRDVIAVMVGELAMNAVQHVRADFEVMIELTDGTLRVEVIDSSGKYPAARPMPPPTSSRGRGLPILDRLADAWGVSPSPHGPGKSIWFMIAVPSPARQGLTDTADAPGTPEPAGSSCPGNMGCVT